MHDTPVFSDFPLYDPRMEHDACGIGFVVNVNGEKSHEIITKGIEVLVNLTRRGACGCDPDTGDGAGVTIQIPHAFFVRECQALVDSIYYYLLKHTAPAEAVHPSVGG